MKKVALTLLAVGAMSFLVADGAALYKKCAGCHGAKGEKKALGKSAVIGGVDAATTEKHLLGYQDGSFGGPMKGLMKGQVAGMSADDIKTLSAYIAGLK